MHQDISRPKQLQRAFTLVEMLVVVAIIAVLLSLCLVGLVKSRNKADAVVCLNNQRQVVLAWTLYSNDTEKLPSNVDGLLGGFTNWVAGNMIDPTDSTNVSLLTDQRRSLLSPYLQNPLVYKCVAEESTNVRSLGMNCRLNPVRELGVPARWLDGHGSKYKVFRTYSDISKPSEVFVTIEEANESINDAYFVVDLSNTANENGVGAVRPYAMIDSPGGAHEGSAVVSFADGHVEQHRWLEANTLSKNRTRFVGPKHRDAAWLQNHSSYEW